MGAAPPFFGVAVNITGLAAQITVSLARMLTDDIRGAFTLITTACDVLMTGLAQFALLVSVHVTTSLLVKFAFTYVLLLVPTFTPFNFHWYRGKLPPLVAVAVKVIGVLGHILFADETTLTLAGKSGFTTMATVPGVETQPLLVVAVTE